MANRKKQINAADGSMGSIVAMTSEDVAIAAAPEGEAKKGPRRFDVVAYNGGSLRLPNYPLPVVVDLSGMTQRRSLVANLDHKSHQRVGNVNAVDNDGKQLKLGGTASAATAYRDEVVASADDGFAWQASIEATDDGRDRIAAGAKVHVNGQEFTGPLFVVRKSQLKGFAFVSHGADDGTAVSIAATSTEGQKMNPEFEKWLIARNWEPTAIAAEDLSRLESMFNADKGTSKPKVVNAADPDAVIAAARSEQTRRQGITNLTAEAIANFPNQIDAVQLLSQNAIEAGTSVQEFEIQILRAGQPTTGMFRPHVKEKKIDGKVLEAALCADGGLEASVMEKYGDQVLQAAHDKYKHGIGLRELLATVAQANGVQGIAHGDIEELLHAAFPSRREIRAAGFSSVDLPGILANVANKFLKAGFDAVESGWRDVSTTRPVKDFKQSTSYSLTGALQYEKVGSAGEIKHGSIDEVEYTNQIDTYARMFAITRKNLIDDDLGALSAVPRKLGRGGALKLNEVFWTEFLADASTFYTTGRGNYFTGSATNLQSASLKTAVQMFRKQIDPDSKPLGVQPSVLLIAPEDEVAADELFTSTHVNTGGSATTEKVPSRNVFQNKYRPVVSSYLSNTSITGYSTTAWFLIAAKEALSLIEVAFLNGKEMPTVDNAQADFNTLGIQMRGYHDFGVNKQEYRAAVKSKGAA